MSTNAKQRTWLLKAQRGVLLRVVGLALCAMLTGFASRASAQTRIFDLTVTGGTGLRLAAGDDDTVTMRSKAFLEAGVRTWVDERPTLHYGGVLRLDLERTPSVAAIPRAYLQKTFMEDRMLVRGLIGIPFYFAPDTLFGIEGGVEGQFKILGGLSVIGGFLFDAFFFGGDRPEGSVPMFFNFALGVALEL